MAQSKSILFVFVLVTLLISLDPGALPVQAAPAPAPLAAGDWPMPYYDSGRTRANQFETNLYPPIDPTPASEVRLNDPKIGLPAAVIADGMLFWYDVDQYDVGGDLLVATDASGQKLWSFGAMPGYRLASAPPVVVGQEVFVLELGSDENYERVSNVVALDRGTGAFLWSRPTAVSENQGRIHLPVAVKDGRAYLIWEDWDAYEGYVTAVDARTGQQFWSTTVDNIGGATASALAISGDHLVALHFSTLVAYNLATGAEVWEVDTQEGVGMVAPSDDMLAVGGRVAVANTGRIAAYSAQSGATLWQDDIDRTLCNSNRLTLASDGDVLAVMGMCNERLVAYDLLTGGERWNVAVPREFGEHWTAIANGVLYVNGLDTQTNAGYIAAHALASGDLLQRLDQQSFGQNPNGYLTGLAVANGRLYAAMATPSVAKLWDGVLYAWGAGPAGSDDGYLPLFNEDSHADTNPDAASEVATIRRDGAFGAEISVAAKIGGLPATLRVYRADGQLYKEAMGSPNAHGNGFWIVPLEHSAEGYEYQVILADGTELSRRKVVMPSDPGTAVDFIVETSSLAWLAPPATVSVAPHTLQLALPAGFPAGETTASLFLQSQGSGYLTVSGERIGDTIRILLDENTAINGEFTATAVARAGMVTAFSPDLNLEIDAADLPEVRVDSITAIAPEPNGSNTMARFHFARSRSPVDLSRQADAQIASVVPDPSGYQVTLWVRTPPENPLDPRTSKWEVGLSGLDAGGNEVDRVTSEIPAAPDGRYVVTRVTQTGTQPIATLAALGATLDGASGAAALGFGPAKILTCDPPGTPPGTPPGPGKPLKLTDLLSLTVELGATAEYAAGGGASSAAYVQGDAVSGQVQACTEAGVLAGGGVQLGPKVGFGAGITLRGKDHAAPANSGQKFGVALGFGPGSVELSHAVPDNFGDGGYGQFGVAVSVVPSAGLSAGASSYACLPLNGQPEPKCCTGPQCGPQDPNPPPPPGGDHPDDTLSVVLQNQTTGDPLAYWRSVASLANRQGLNEMAAYAQYRYRDAAYLQEIRGYPAGTTLSAQQQRVLRAWESNRLLGTAAMLSKRGIIVAQTAQIEAQHANVLANGYYAEMQKMLSYYGIPNRLVAPDFSPDALSGSLLVIPTAGLYGLDADTTLAARFERFVARGGTLLVMSQPGVNALDVLPGDWQQVDYQQDISCYSDAMTIRQYHPILASAFRPKLTAYVDGYMTAVPSAAAVLMQRTKNAQAAFVLAEHGQGRMLVTNMYDDWGRTVGQTSPDVRGLFRDALRWASIGDVVLPDVRPGSRVTLDVTVTNLTDTPAHQLQWLVRDPNGPLVDSGIPVAGFPLGPGETRPRTVSFTPGAGALGIWSIGYQLLDADGEVVQGETQAGHFIVSNPPGGLSAMVGPGDVGGEEAILASSATVSLALDRPAYKPGENVRATLGIALSDPAAVGSLRVLVSLGEATVEQEVAAPVTQQLVFDLPADFSGNGLLFYGVYEATSGQGLYLNTRWVQRAGEAITVVPAAPSYEPGDTVTLNISGAYQGKLFVEGADFARTIDVQGQGSVAFELPGVLSSGPVRVSYEDAGSQRTARFDITGPRVTVSGMKTGQAVIAAGAEAVVEARVISDRALDVRITGQMVDGNNYAFPVDGATHSLVAGEQTLTMTVPISTTTSGSVRLELAIADAARTGVVYVEAHRHFTIDAPVLQTIRTANGQLAMGGSQEILLDWYSPAARTTRVTVWLDGSPVFSGSVELVGGFQTTSVRLPPALSAGSHTVYAEAEWGEDLTTQAASIITVASDGIRRILLPLILR